ncbi:MAG: protein kinase domain-containing protein, partial [Candidatus Zixiibacteriota bacterium]
MTEQYIGNYKILKKIGAGGMAKVYLAVHKDVPNLRVVLKILSDSRLVERFKQEADKLALLDGHPNICQIKHFFNHGDDFAIAMEYIEGTSLDEFLKSRGKLGVGEAAKIISHVLDILDFAHQKGIYHRDIKPGNIMVDRKGQVKIIDFGIAKAETDPNLTLAGTSCGTPAYMAPEQFTPTEKVNYAKVDIYAVGITLYYILTGELPFKGDNEFAIRDAKIFSDPVKPRTLNGDIPKDMEATILKALQKSPEDRFQTCAEMHKALSPYLGEITPRAGSEDTPTEASSATPSPDKQPSSGPKKKSGLVIGLIAGVAVVVVAALSYFIFFKNKPEPPHEVVEIVKPVLTLPALLTPADDSVLLPGPLSFSWTPLEGADIYYYLEFAADTFFSASRSFTYLTSSELTVDTTLHDGNYYWRVRAEDADGNRGDFSLVRSFTVATPAPVVTESFVT